LTNNLNRFYI